MEYRPVQSGNVGGKYGESLANGQMIVVSPNCTPATDNPVDMPLQNEAIPHANLKGQNPDVNKAMTNDPMTPMDPITPPKEKHSSSHGSTETEPAVPN